MYDIVLSSSINYCVSYCLMKSWPMDKMPFGLFAHIAQVKLQNEINKYLHKIRNWLLYM